MNYQLGELRAWLYLAPVLSILILFRAIPFLWNIQLSFQKKNLVGETEFIGLSNYKYLIQDPLFLKSLFNTIVFAGTIPVGIIIALAIGLLLKNKFPGSNVFRTVMFLPYIIMMVAAGVIWNYIFQEVGLLNQILMNLGLLPNPVAWLENSNSARFAVFTVHVWKIVGVFLIIILAGLQTIPSNLYEVAQVEGTSKFQRFRHITYPLLRPTIGACILIGITTQFDLFDLIMTMTQGGPGGSTEILVTQLYKNAFRYGQLGYGATIANVLFIIASAGSLLTGYYVRRAGQ